MPRVTCPECGRENDFLPFLAGMRVKCAACPGWVQVPKGQPAAGPSPPPAPAVAAPRPTAAPPPPAPPPAAVLPVLPPPPQVPVPTPPAGRGVASKSWEEILATAPPPPPQPPTPTRPPPADGPAGWERPPPASRLFRFLARWLDDVFQGVAFAAGMALLFAVNGFRPLDSVGERAVVMVGCLAVTVVPYWGYNAYQLSTRGQTIGKRLLGIRVVRDADYGPVGFVNGVLLRDGSTLAVAVLAFGVALLGGVIGWTCLTYAMLLWPVYAWANILCIFSPEQQCLHDRIAGTQVVQVPK